MSVFYAAATVLCILVLMVMGLAACYRHEMAKRQRYIALRALYECVRHYDELRFKGWFDPVQEPNCITHARRVIKEQGAGSEP